MKKLAIIGAGLAAVNYATNAKEMGVETFCFAWEKGALAKDVVDHFYPISITDKEKILEICLENNINGIVATTELTVSVAAYIAEKMSLIGIPYNIAKDITNKYSNRNRTQGVNGFNHPNYVEILTEEELVNSNLSFPYILKPTSKGGKRGITVVYDETQIHNAFEYALKEQGSDAPIIVEEFIDGGIEYSVESLSYKGKNYIVQVTQKQSSGPPHCVELGHHQPALLSQEMRAKVEKVMDEALTKLGLQNGPCHTEIKIKNDEIYLIEFNARPGGDRISYPLTDLSSGYEYIKGAISIALDSFLEPNISTCKKRSAGIFFVTDQTKELKPLFDECEKYSWLYQKNFVSENLSSIHHNNSGGTNYFIYCSDTIPKEIIEFIGE